MRHFTFLTFLSLLIFISGCKKSSNTATNTNGSCGSFSCNLGGSSFTSTTLNNTLIRETNPPGKRMDIRATMGNQQIILSIGDALHGATGDDVALGSYFLNESDFNCTNVGGTSYCSGGLMTVLDGVNPTHFSLPDEDTGRITITSIDVANKKVSGTFSGSVTANDFVTKLVINNGSFTNACYRVQ